MRPERSNQLRRLVRLRGNAAFAFIAIQPNRLERFRPRLTPLASISFQSRVISSTPRKVLARFMFAAGPPPHLGPPPRAPRPAGAPGRKARGGHPDPRGLATPHGMGRPGPTRTTGAIFF